MSLGLFKHGTLFTIIIILNNNYIGSQKTEDTVNNDNYCLAALVDFELRGKGLTLFPVQCKNIEVSEDNEDYDDHKFIKNLKDNRQRGKRSYKNFISKILWGSPYLSNISNINLIKTIPTDDEEQMKMNLENTANLTGSNELNKADIKPEKTRMQRVKSLLRYMRRKGKFKNYINRIWNKHQDVDNNKLSEKSNFENVGEVNSTSLVNNSGKNKVLVVRIPNSLGELPIVVVKDPKNQILSLSVQVSDNNSLMDHKPALTEVNLLTEPTTTNPTSPFTLKPLKYEEQQIIPYFQQPPYYQQPYFQQLGITPSPSIVTVQMPHPKIYVQNPHDRKLVLKIMNKQQDFPYRKGHKNKFIPSQRQLNKLRYQQNPMQHRLKEQMMKYNQVPLGYNNYYTPYKYNNNFIACNQIRNGLNETLEKLITQDKINEIIIKQIHKILDKNKIKQNTDLDDYYDDN